MNKFEHYEQKKREEFLARLAGIFSTKVRVVEPLVKFTLKSSLRINTNKFKGNIELLVKQIENLGVELSKIPWAPSAYEIHGDKTLVSESKYFEDGLVYIQNASSLIPPLVLDVQPGEHVLDLCAAPGGKASYIAELSANSAHLYINDKSYPRIKDLERVMERYGVEVTKYYNLPGEEISEQIEIKFDKILVDAQCSNEGRLDLKHPRAMRFWSMGKKPKLQALQIRLLESAYTMLKPGGEIVYSTCTFAPEENEEVIDRFTRKHKDLSVDKLDLAIPNLVPGLTTWQGRSLSSHIKNSGRVLPTEYMEGFYICKIRQGETNEDERESI